MINFSPIQPPVSTPKAKTQPSGNAAVAGTEINKDAQRIVQERPKKRRGKDRRQRDIKPLIDMRSGKDRREDPNSPSIDIEV